MLGLGIAALRATPDGLTRPSGFLVVNTALVLVGAGLALAHLAGVWRRGPAATPGTTALTVGSSPRLGAPAAGIVAGTALTAIGPHLAIVFAGAIITAWSSWLLQGSSRSRIPLSPALTVLLVPAYLMLRTIAGPIGLTMAALPIVPLSPAAERLLSPAVLITGWALGGLWPLHRQVHGAWSAPAAALLWYRVGAAMMPEGMAHWQTAIYPVVLMGMWHAAWTRRPALLAVGGALLGLASLDPRGVAGAPWLLAAALALGSPIPARTLVAGALGAWGGLEVATGGLRTQVVYTVLAAAAVAAALIPPTGRSIFGPTKTG